MRTTQDDDDTNPLLVVDEHCRSYYPRVNGVVTRGVVVHLSKWPVHLFNIFIGVCSVLGVFIAFGVVIVMLLSEDTETRCWISRDLGIVGEYQNLFFVKNSNAWRQDELCAIESSAREYTDYNVYLVNILTRAPHHHPPVNTSLRQTTDGPENTKLSALTEKYTNVHSLDVYSDAFFVDSILRNVYESIDEQLLTIAVKSQLVWEYSGIALDTSQVDEIKYFKEFFSRPDVLSQPVKTVAISSDGSIQVSPVPCHAFFEVFLKKLGNKMHNVEKIVRDTYKSFCHRNDKCHGAQIFHYKARNIMRNLTCPLIFQGDGPEVNSTRIL